MNQEVENLHRLIRGMREAYTCGENAMAFARNHLANIADGDRDNIVAATLIAYDLQAGTYTADARANPKYNALWGEQLAQLISPVLPQSGSILEVGCGEATTLASVIGNLGGMVSSSLGFDLSWSRIAEGQRWLVEKKEEAKLFVGDLFKIPLADSTIDVVYTSHSLEPNGGREDAALRECLRVAREAVVLVEPLYEFASVEARIRMEQHGYVRGLHDVAKRLGAQVLDFRLLEHCSNPLNPSGVLLLRKKTDATINLDCSSIWRCPLTGAILELESDFCFAPEVGIAYPVLRGIPMLRSEHAIVASGLSEHYQQVIR